ncbi:hypothetical protein DAPPUDRAFT_112751 [Daphnia pulex]|uniref:Uncharacterized protein n=1 Tax=Daphnia pulex TaxID=6669 RepID=E9HCY5_DAPPU|nr:hypothetical protein DAPPUDRAFT_112751 [Daphnia pulex]|eukprot:EFX70441.1 hypothetical protein DAPPUDRAFT_112751 [Daphnia pulex]
MDFQRDAFYISHIVYWPRNHSLSHCHCIVLLLALQKSERSKRHQQPNRRPSTGNNFLFPFHRLLPPLSLLDCIKLSWLPILRFSSEIAFSGKTIRGARMTRGKVTACTPTSFTHGNVPSNDVRSGDGRRANTAHGEPEQPKRGGRLLAGPAQKIGICSEPADPARKTGEGRHLAGPARQKRPAATPPDPESLTKGAKQVTPEVGMVQHLKNRFQKLPLDSLFLRSQSNDSVNSTASDAPSSSTAGQRHSGRSSVSARRSSVSSRQSSRPSKRRRSTRGNKEPTYISRPAAGKSEAATPPGHLILSHQQATPEQGMVQRLTNRFQKLSLKRNLLRSQSAASANSTPSEAPSSASNSSTASQRHSLAAVAAVPAAPSVRAAPSSVSSRKSSPESPRHSRRSVRRRPSSRRRRSTGDNGPKITLQHVQGRSPCWIA